MDNVLDIQRQCIADSEEWFPKTSHDLVYMGLALSGEVGEFCNKLKKVERGSVDLDSEARLELILELTDVFIYLCNCAAILNADLGKAYDYKRKVNIGRFSREDAGAPNGVLSIVQPPDGEGEVL